MRTKRTIQNVISTFIPYIILGILGFVKVKVFVSFFSDDLYSINQLFSQVLGYLTLVDAGFGLLVVQKLYVKFAEDKKEEINKIYSTAKIFFRHVALIILGLGILVSFIIHFFTKANINNLYMQIIFLIFVIRNIIDYFFYAPRFIIEADQKLYKINYYINVIRILQIISEIILVMLGLPYLVVLIPSIFISLFLNIIIKKKVFKLYPWLEDTKEYNRQYLKGTKDIISQKVAGIFYSNTDIVLLSTFVNPLTVNIYSFYNYILKFVEDLSYIIANAITPTFANVINTNENAKSYELFKELNIIFYFGCAFLSIMFFLLMNPFISLWTGSKYVVNNLTLILFILVTFRFISMRIVTIVIHSCGLFKEIRNITLLEAFLNIVISLSLVFKLGLNGVLLGTIISTYLTTFWYIPKLIYQKKFKKNCLEYFLKYVSVLVITFSLIMVLANLNLPNILSVSKWVGAGFSYSIIVFIVLLIIFYICFSDFRKFLNRVRYIVKKGC